MSGESKDYTWRYSSLSHRDKALLKYIVTYCKVVEPQKEKEELRMGFDGALLQPYKWNPHRVSVAVAMKELESLEKRGWITLHWGESRKSENWAEGYSVYVLPTNRAQLAVMRQFGASAAKELQARELEVLCFAYATSDKEFGFAPGIWDVDALSFMQIWDIQAEMPRLVAKGYAVLQQDWTSRWRLTPEGIALAQEIEQNPDFSHKGMVVVMGDQQNNAGSGTFVAAQNSNQPTIQTNINSPHTSQTVKQTTSGVNVAELIALLDEARKQLSSSESAGKEEAEQALAEIDAEVKSAKPNPSRIKMFAVRLLQIAPYLGLAKSVLEICKLAGADMAMARQIPHELHLVLEEVSRQL